MRFVGVSSLIPDVASTVRFLTSSSIHDYLLRLFGEHFIPRRKLSRTVICDMRFLVEHICWFPLGVYCSHVVSYKFINVLMHLYAGVTQT